MNNHLTLAYSAPDRRRAPERNRFAEGMLMLFALVMCGILGPWLVAFTVSLVAQ
jgi:hypothetical protein